MIKNLLLGPGPESLAGIFSTDAGKYNHDVAFVLTDQVNVSDGNSYKLSNSHMSDANNYLLRANKSLHKSWPTDSQTLNNNASRDSYLVRWCERVYTAGFFTSDASLLKIAGDIAWPCQVYVDRFLYDQEPMELCELYFFDIKSDSWFVWNSKWKKIAVPPMPHGVYAVLGNGKITRTAKSAIDSLWLG
jgi:hypothetical protein